jgi:hypothetical protein
MFIRYMYVTMTMDGSLGELLDLGYKRDLFMA